MEHTKFLKIEIDYSRAGSVICHYAANDVVRSKAHFRVNPLNTELNPICQ